MSPGGSKAAVVGANHRAWSAVWRRHFHSGRGGRAKLALTSSLASRILLTSTSLVTLPLTVRYLGNEGYGLMVVMSSVVGWLQFSSLGLGVALQNPLTDARASGDLKTQGELLSTAVLSLFAIGTVLLGLGGVAFPLINWLAVFPPTTDRFVHQIPPALAVVYGGFVSSIVVGFIGPVYAARQELHIGNLPVLAAGVLNFVVTVLAVRLDLGLVGIVFANVGTGTVIQCAFAIWTLYFRGLPELRPRIGEWSVDAARALFGRGISFLMLQICTIVFFQADAFMIAHFLSTSEVTPYSVAQRVFVQVGGLFALVSGSMWAAYGDAKATGDFRWIRRTRRTIERLFVIFYASLAIGMVLMGHRLLSWWVGSAAAPNTLLIASIACYFCVREWTSLHAVLLNGLDVIRPQVWVLATTAVLILTLNLLLIRPLGAMGLAIGGALGFSALSAWYLPLLAERTVRTLESAGAESRRRRLTQS